MADRLIGVVPVQLTAGAVEAVVPGVVGTVLRSAPVEAEGAKVEETAIRVAEAAQLRGQSTAASIQQ